MTSWADLTVDRDLIRKVFTAAAFASIALATGCSSVPSLYGEPSAAAAEATETGETTHTASTEPVAPASLPDLQELLIEDRFVPLAVALQRSGLVTVLDGLDDFVLVAPIGDAFASSGADIGIEYSTLMSDSQLLEPIMRYHVVADPSTNPSWRTLNGYAIDVDGSEPDTIDRVNGIDVVDRIHVRNGTVLVVPRLLFPAPESRTVRTSLQPVG